MSHRLPTTVAPLRYEIRLEPDLEAGTFVGEETVTLTVRAPVVVPDGYAAVSNTAVVGERPAGPGRRVVTFADTIRMSTYLVAFFVGELEATEAVVVGKTPLRIWCVPGKRHLARFGLEVGA